MTPTRTSPACIRPITADARLGALSVGPAPAAVTVTLPGDPEPDR
jgi:hypothetical protein